MVFSLSPGFYEYILEDDGISHYLRYVRCFFSLIIIFEFFGSISVLDPLMVDDTEYITSWKYKGFGIWGWQRFGKLPRSQPCVISLWFSQSSPIVRPS